MEAKFTLIAEFLIILSLLLIAGLLYLLGNIVFGCSWLDVGACIGISGVINIIIVTIIAIIVNKKLKEDDDCERK